MITQKTYFNLLQFQFNEEEWEVVSGDAKDLITAMMQSDPQKRLTIDGVLKHKWLAVSFTFEYPEFLIAQNLIIS